MSLVARKRWWKLMGLEDSWAVKRGATARETRYKARIGPFNKNNCLLWAYQDKFFLQPWRKSDYGYVTKDVCLQKRKLGSERSQSSLSLTAMKEQQGRVLDPSIVATELQQSSQFWLGTAFAMPEVVWRNSTVLLTSNQLALFFNPKLGPHTPFSFLLEAWVIITIPLLYKVHGISPIPSQHLIWYLILTFLKQVLNIALLPKALTSAHWSTEGDLQGGLGSSGA